MLKYPPLQKEACKVTCVFEKKNRLGALWEMFVSSLFNLSAGKLSHDIRPLSFSFYFPLMSLFNSFNCPLVFLLIPFRFLYLLLPIPFILLLFFLIFLSFCFMFPFIPFIFPFRFFWFHLNSQKTCPTKVVVSLLNSLLKT